MHRLTTRMRSSTTTARKTLPAACVVALMLIVSMLAGCGSGDSDGPPGQDTTTNAPSGEGITHPTGADQLVLRIETGGGFVPVEYNFTTLPEFSLYGDGRVIVPGPMIEIYPGPALPNLQTTMVSEETVQAILAAAREAGLFDPTFDYGQPNITDVGTTTVTINAQDSTYASSIYALGMEQGTSGLTMEQQQARAAVSELRGQLSGLGISDAFGTKDLTWESYDYQALAIYSRPVDTSDPSYDPEVPPNHLQWPLGDLATLGEKTPPEGYRRVVVSGEELATLRPLLSEATQITLWESAGAEYHLFFRPLLPDETV